MPGAVNLPVVDDARVRRGGHPAQDRSARRLPDRRAALVPQPGRRTRAALISRFKPDDRFLVYCFRGGKRSALWAANLRLIGFTVDVVPGGWKRYRNWVRESLATCRSAFEYRVLCGPTNCGKTRLLQELARQGEQVLDLETPGQPQGLAAGRPAGPAAAHAEDLRHAGAGPLRRFDPARPVWVEAESKKVGRLLVPEELTAAMRRAPHRAPERADGRARAPVPRGLRAFRGRSGSHGRPAGAAQAAGRRRGTGALADARRPRAASTSCSSA